MEHEEVERLLKSGNEPISLQTRRLILAEFDRLKLRVAALAADLWDANAARDEAQAENERIDKIVKATVAQWNRDVQELAGTIDTLQSWLGRICELAKPSLEFVGARIAATDLRQQGWKTIPDLLETIATYLDSQKQSEPPFPERPCDACDHWDDCAGCTSPPKAEDCLISNSQKPSEKTGHGHICRDGRIIDDVWRKDCPICNPQEGKP